jgi:hypothetical protein
MSEYDCQMTVSGVLSLETTAQRYKTPLAFHLFHMTAKVSKENQTSVGQSGTKDILRSGDQTDVNEKIFCFIVYLSDFFFLNGPIKQYRLLPIEPIATL